METIDYKTSEALAWLRYVLTNNALPSISDWQGVYDFCDKQKIGGVCEPTHYDVHVKDDVLLEWMALNRLLNRSNEQSNKRVCQLFRMLEKDGFKEYEQINFEILNGMVFIENKNTVEYR